MAKAAKVRTISDLAPAEYNPRTITDEKLASLERAMRAFGDLSGVVFNRRTGRLIGGHQRKKNFDPSAPITITERLSKPSQQGTVALGYIESEGERWAYREVDWDEQTEGAANVAANKHGGEWEMPKLTDLLSTLDAEGFDATLTGFDEQELANMLSWTPDVEADSESSESPGDWAGDGDQWICAVTCESEGQLAKLYDRLKSEGYQCKLIT